MDFHPSFFICYNNDIFPAILFTVNFLKNCKFDYGTNYRMFFLLYLIKTYSTPKFLFYDPGKKEKRNYRNFNRRR